MSTSSSPVSQFLQVVAELYNGQVWVQPNFPCFKVVVLMLDHELGVLTFCKLGFQEDMPPLLMTGEDGKWMYTGEELLKDLTEKKYTYVGEARITIRRPQ